MLCPAEGKDLGSSEAYSQFEEDLSDLASSHEDSERDLSHPLYQIAPEYMGKLRLAGNKGFFKYNKWVKMRYKMEKNWHYEKTAITTT